MQTKDAAEMLIKKIKQLFEKNNKKRVVIGLSGGIDSAVCAALLAKSLGSKNVTAILMPVKGISSEKHLWDAVDLAKSLKIKHFNVELNGFCAPFFELPWIKSNTAGKNLFARIRAVILYDFANSFDALVCGTGNKSEILLGYFTKYGDAAADFFPIGGLYKTQVRELAVFFDLPLTFLEKEPTAELEVGQTDEREIGIKYAQIDEILGLAEEGLSKSQILSKGLPKPAVERVFYLMNQSKHKRELPPVL